MADKHYLIFMHGEHFTDNGENKPYMELFSEDNRRVKYSESEALDVVERMYKAATDGKLDGFFNGHDYRVYANINKGRVDYLSGFTCADVMGQQAYEVVLKTEDELTDTILKYFEEHSENRVLQLPSMDFTGWGDYYSNGATYKPVTIVSRIDDDGEQQYDVESECLHGNGDKTIFVENLDCIGFLPLFNIYLSLVCG